MSRNLTLIGELVDNAAERLAAYTGARLVGDPHADDIGRETMCSLNAVLVTTRRVRDAVWEQLQQDSAADALRRQISPKERDEHQSGRPRREPVAGRPHPINR